MSSAIVQGSLAAVANKSGRSVAEQVVNAKVAVLVDVSGSMDAPDSRGGRRRIDVARQELSQLQSEQPGALAIIAFSDSARLVPGGEPPEPFGGTDLAGALTFAKKLDGTGMRFIVVSDGEPNDEDAALEVARTYESPISTCYCGPEAGQRASGFLRRLAQAGKGQHVEAPRLLDLADAVRPLLAAGGSRP